MNETRDKDTLYTDAEWHAYMLPYYEELIEQQKRWDRWYAVVVALAVIACLLIIVYCVARIVL